MITIDKAKCTKCGWCAEECRGSVIVCQEDRSPLVRYPEQCVNCGHCVAVCPAGAINSDVFPYEMFKDLPPLTVSAESMKNILLSRRSVGVFKDSPVAREMIEQLILGATHAGSASNGQTEGFVVVQDKQVLLDLEDLVLEVMWDNLRILGNVAGRQLAKVRYGPEMSGQIGRYYSSFKKRKENNQLRGSIFRNAPVVVVVHGLKKNALAATNCAIAARNMEIMSLPMGLGTCWAGFLIAAAQRDKKIAEFLQLPKGHNVFAAIMLGFPKRQYKKMIPRKERTVRWT